MKNQTHFLYLRILGVMTFAFLTGCGVPTDQPPVEILWDNYGVPHIYGKEIDNMYYGFGWAQMENHANLILQLYGEARGKAAEYWGEAYLESDKKIWLFRIPEYSENNYRNQNLVSRSCLDAFVRGMNDYTEKYPASIDKSMRQVLPVTEKDVLAHILRVVNIEFIAGEDLYHINNTAGKGSNAYAIAPSRSASGNAMLVTNPHLPWYGFFRWFEAHLISENFDAYGVSLVGVPALSMAFNDNLGWALTVNTLDGSDRYELELEEDGYILDGRKMQFESQTHRFKVKNENGKTEELDIRFEYSEHGPVVSKSNNKAYALRMVGMNNAGIFEQFHNMAASVDLNEFEQALKMLQIPMFNIVYADQAGNILYLFNGNIPVRNSGNYASWKGKIDGTLSKNIWHEIHPYDDLPKVINPPGGFLQNCNDPPWTCTFPPVIDPSEYPEYFAPVFMHFRAQRATNMVLADTSVSFDRLKEEYKLNTGMEAADRFIDDLLLAVERFPDTLALQAATVLRHWDRKTENDSRGAILFARWFDKVNSNIFRTRWDPDLPNTTPDGISDQKRAVEILVEAAKEVLDKYGALDIAWGDIHRFRINGLDFPANGGPERYGIFRTIDYRNDTANIRIAMSGDTYVAVTEFGKNVKAEVLLSYGNATQPGNKHNGDQLQLLSEKKLRPALRERQEISHHLEKIEIPGIKLTYDLNQQDFFILTGTAGVIF